jgi:hypothetical protein
VNTKRPPKTLSEAREVVNSFKGSVTKNLGTSLLDLQQVVMKTEDPELIEVYTRFTNDLSHFMAHMTLVVGAELHGSKDPE